MAIKTREYQEYAMLSGLLLFIPLLIGGRQKLWYRFLENMQMINIMIYLNVQQGFNLDEFLRILNVAQFEFIPNIMKTAANHLGILTYSIDDSGFEIIVNGQEAPTKFSLNEKSSSFIYNAGNLMLLNIGIWIIFLICFTIHYFFEMLLQSLLIARL